MSLKTIIIRWHGPHSLEQIKTSDRWNGLYMLAGRRKYQREEQMQYCGITEGYFCDRLNSRHHKMKQIKHELSIWLGEVAYPTKFNRSHLELAEQCIIYFWQLKLNERKIIKPPQSVCVVSHWFTRSGNTRLNRLAIYKDLPDVLSWDEKRWRTGNLYVWGE
ncbi:MAG: hypothetical protein JO316_20295 [Abitibacteriaceae bacterium]|nr:hypothetical protein [Abditibacteriaceae bacterium]MBV9867698.1 hypothetical protein [Abditibacteriaceae bacterium]